MTDAPTTTFFKLEGLGNDFVLIDSRGLVQHLPDALIRAWADRRTGIGFDQLLVLHSDSTAAARVEIRNADGSSAEQCGNGMRAIAAWLDRRGELGQGAGLATPAGPVDIDRAAEGRYTALLPGPTRLDSRSLGLEAPLLDPADVQSHLISMGNPHLVLLTEHEPSEESLRDAVAAVERGTGWRNAANISLAQMISADRIALRVHERGVGPTAACGSAACAVAWAATDRRGKSGPIRVEQPGGSLVVDFDTRSGRVRSTGPARVVFEGRIS